jgi:hypothetical protein
MFCPQCKAECIRGVTRCSDCDVALVESLPESGGDSDGELSEASLRKAWSGESQDDCVRICEQLRDAGIPFKVIPHARQFFKRVDENYEIGVPAEYCEQVKEIIASDGIDFSDEASNQAILELPAEDSRADAPPINEDWDPDKWDPDDATVEIQFQNRPERADMIESSLRENYIHYRADVLDNGSHKISVMPRDEIRAREIVREIEDGAPPQ